MYTIQWGGHLRSAKSVQEVDRILEELHVAFTEEEPQLVTVEITGTGDSLAIGLGQERSVLNYVCGSKEPPYFTSVGELEVDEPIVFRFGEEWSEFPMRNSITISAALNAVRYFCATGELSDQIQWEED